MLAEKPVASRAKATAKVVGWIEQWSSWVNIPR